MICCHKHQRIAVAMFALPGRPAELPAGRRWPGTPAAGARSAGTPPGDRQPFPALLRFIDAP